MQLTLKQLNKDAIFVFQFTDMDEFKFWIARIKSCSGSTCFDTSRFESAVEKLKRRVTDKYADAEHGVSSVLYLREFADFAFGSIVMMCMYHDLLDRSVDECKRQHDFYVKLCDEYAKLVQDYDDVMISSVK